MQNKVKISHELLNSIITLFDNLDISEFNLEPEDIRLFGYIYHSLINKRNAYNNHNAYSLKPSDNAGQSSVCCQQCVEPPF